ncbi:MAG: hypothetical protein IPK85_17620 [Gemmatimonadetes bacterium]|nr:hypothetical protein [Gemmatimonadota bacterium]
MTTLLDQWASEMTLPAAESAAWHDAGRWHDALRDAGEAELRPWVGTLGSLPLNALHGPAAAARLAADGEDRADVLEAIRWHTLGSGAWSRVGQALYLADFLEPGRSFADEERAGLRAKVPREFAACLRRVVQWRLEWALRDGKALFPQTISLWNAVR